MCSGKPGARTTTNSLVLAVYCLDNHPTATLSFYWSSIHALCLTGAATSISDSTHQQGHCKLVLFKNICPYSQTSGLAVTQFTVQLKMNSFQTKAKHWLAGCHVI